MLLVARVLGRACCAALTGGSPLLLSRPATATGVMQAAHRFFASQMPEVTEIRMPALSPTMAAGNIVSLRKAVGDKVSEGDMLAEIETDKATLEFESTDEGYLAKLFVEEGQQEVPVGQLFCILVDSAADVPSVSGYEDTKKSTSEPESSPPMESAPVPQKSAPSSVSPKASPSTTKPPVVTSSSSSKGDDIRASPLARRLARERGIDLRQVTGTGPEGRVSSRDIETFVPPTAASAPTFTTMTTASGAAPESAVFDASDLRQSIAQRMLWSKQNVPHYYLTVDCNVDKTLELCTRLTSSSKGKYEVSLNDVIIKASAVACRRVPAVNSSWQESTIRMFESVDVGMQVPVEGGFLSPVVRDADRKGLVEIARETADLMTRVQESQLTADQTMGATFTISNLGLQGVTKFAPIIEPPQAGILGIGATQTVVVPNPDSGVDALPFRNASVVSITLSCDHRVIDGAVGSEWLKVFKDCLEDPINLVV